MLKLAAVLAILIGVLHSYLGERAILIRLLRRNNLPRLFGGDWFTKRVLRFAWHLTTIAWWGFAAILYIFSAPTDNLPKQTLIIISAVFLLSGILSSAFTKFKHFSWIIFWAISILSLFVALSM